MIDVILGDRTGAPFLSGDEVASRAGVHPAAATRLAKKLGYAGYPALRAALQSDLREDISPSARFRTSLDRASDSTVLAELVAGELDALAELVRTVPPSAIDRAAGLLANARHVHLYGHGNSVVLTELMHRRLRRFGIHSSRAVGNGRDIAEHLVGLSSQDVVMAFAFRRPSTVLPKILAHCVTRGAASILVTDTVVTVDPAPTVLLSASRGDGHQFQSLTVPMAIANAIVLAVAASAPESSLSSLDQLPALIDHFSGDA